MGKDGACRHRMFLMQSRFWCFFVTEICSSHWVRRKTKSVLRLSNLCHPKKFYANECPLHNFVGDLPRPVGCWSTETSSAVLSCQMPGEGLFEGENTQRSFALARLRSRKVGFVYTQAYRVKKHYQSNSCAKNHEPVITIKATKT